MGMLLQIIEKPLTLKVKHLVLKMTLNEDPMCSVRTLKLPYLDQKLRLRAINETPVVQEFSLPLHKHTLMNITCQSPAPRTVAKIN